MFSLDSDRWHAHDASWRRDRLPLHTEQGRNLLALSHDAIPGIDCLGFPTHDVLRHRATHPVIVGIARERAAEVMEQTTRHTRQLAGSFPSFPHVPDGQAVTMENEFRQRDTRISYDGAGSPTAGDDFRQLAHEGHGLRLTVLPILRGKEHHLHFHAFLRFLVFDDLFGDIGPAQVLKVRRPSPQPSSDTPAPWKAWQKGEKKFDISSSLSTWVKEAGAAQMHPEKSGAVKGGATTEGDKGKGSKKTEPNK